MRGQDLLGHISRISNRVTKHFRKNHFKRETMKTIILILLDESGSMASQKSDVIGGFNTFIQDQKAIKDDEANVTFIKFNSSVTVVLQNEPIANVQELVFSPGSGTALYDAIWHGVQLVEKVESKFDRVICVIMTDGEDNSSRNITSAGISDLVKRKVNEGKWTFLYIGDRPTRWARRTGMSTLNVSAYDHGHQGSNFAQAHIGVSSIRGQSGRQISNAFDNIDNVD